MSGAFQQVHLRVNDAATGQPTPVRIRCTGPDGTYYAPFGCLVEARSEGNIEVDGKTFAYIDGACEIRLPVGPVQIEVHKGPEYTPLLENPDDANFSLFASGLHEILGLAWRDGWSASLPVFLIGITFWI